MPVILVTGASGNLGFSVVRHFLQKGWKVFGTVVPNHEGAQELSDPNFERIAVDLLNETETAKAIEAIVARVKVIDAAVLTVGGFTAGGIGETATSDITKQISLNFETAYNVARPVFAEMMKQGSGRIFLMGSRPGVDMRNSKGMVAYGLSKSLVFRLAELMNLEAKGKNVAACVIAPSTIDTPQNRISMPGADPSKWVKPEEIAAIIEFYCTQHANVIREPVIKVYGNS